jgi:DAACS family dicarboxylate/amino acid:cation (Na+ or H+) symporter
MASDSSHKLPHTWILIGLVAGATAGSVVNATALPAYKSSVEWVVKTITKPLGDIFMNLLFLAIIPLVFSSLAVGVTRLGGMGNVGRIGVKTISYFLVTTFFAAVIGLTLVNVVRPGDRLPPQEKEQLMESYRQGAGEILEKKAPFGVETFVNIVPKNPLEAFVKKDMLAVIFTSILFGIALTQIDPTKAARIIELLEGVNQITEFVIRLAMRIAPIGVFMLIFSTTALFGYKLLLALLAFVLTVIGGLSIHMFVVLPLLVLVFGGMNPVSFFSKVIPSLATAFSTSSSSATLPTAIKNAEEDLYVPRPIAQFVLPLSASMNHNGTALFESVVVLFLAQVFGVNLSIEQQIQVLILCVLTATGMAGVPGGSLPLIGLVMESVGVPGSLLAIVLGVDRILDMCRTTVNVAADLTTAVFVARTERGRNLVEPAAQATR